MLIFQDWNFWVLTCISYWNHPRHSSICTDLDSFQYRLVRTKRMGIWVYHRDGSAGSVLRTSLLCLGTILLPCSIPPLEIPQGTNHHRFMHVIRRDVPVCLVSAQESSREIHLTRSSCWNSYFGSYLQVVHRLDIVTANYVLNTLSLTSFIFSPIFGV